MPIYKNGQKLKAFKGDYRPVNLHKGNMKIAGWKYAELSGESLNIDGTYKDSCHLTIKGKSEQTVIPQGKNLVDYNKVVEAVNNENLCRIEQIDGRTCLAIKADTNVFEKVFLHGGFRGNTRYTLSCVGKRDIDPEKGGVIKIMYTDNTSSFFAPKSLEWETVTFTTLVGKTVHWIGTTYAGMDGSWTYIDVNTFQIEQGTSATSYVPYVTPSPTTWKLAPIDCVNNFKVISAGENLFDYKSFLTNLQSNGYTNCYLLSDKEGIGFNNIASNHDKSRYLQGCFEPNTQYRLSATGRVVNGTHEDAIILFRFSYTDGTTSTTLSFGSILGTKTLLSATNKTIDYIHISRQYDGDAEVYDFMLTKGTSSHTYKPFKGSSVVDFPYKLRSVPDGTCDEIVVNNINKKAYLHRNVGELVINENSNFGLFTNTYGTTQFQQGLGVMNNGCQLGDTNTLCCNMFTQLYNDAGTISPNALMMFTMGVNSYIRFTVSPVDFTGANDLKEWLAENNMIIHYKQSTTEITEIPYEEIKTYYPQTNIYTNAVVQPILNGKFRVMEAVQ